MRKIREKLRSQNGASILLALLFFLLCGMVGASVLMAAASNAGKSRSSREEQQKYLTLSSALQLVCDELTSAKYTAVFSLEKTEEIMKNVGTETEQKWELDHYKYYYKQTDGVYTGKFPENVLPLRNALNKLFAAKRPLPWNTTSGENEYEYSSTLGTTNGESFELTLAVDKNDEPGLAQPVKVTVTLEGNYRLSLKASLEDDATYAMYVTLPPTGMPTLTAGQTSSAPIGWTLGQIKRGAGT